MNVSHINHLLTRIFGVKISKCSSVQFDFGESRARAGSVMVVEVVGVPCVGKTTLLNRVYSSLPKKWCTDWHYSAIDVSLLQKCYSTDAYDQYQYLLEREIRRIDSCSMRLVDKVLSIRHAVDVFARTIIVESAASSSPFILSDGFFQQYSSIILKVVADGGVNLDSVFSNKKVIHLYDDVDRVARRVEERRGLINGAPAYVYDGRVGVDLTNEIQRRLDEYRKFSEMLSFKGLPVLNINSQMNEVCSARAICDFVCENN